MGDLKVPPTEIEIAEVLSILGGSGAEVIRRLAFQRDLQQQEIERLRAAIKQLAKDHPDTAVSWPHNGLTCYQDLHDWASFVLYGAAKVKGGGDDPQPDPEMLRRSEADFAAGRARPIEDVIADIKAKAKGDWDG